MSPSITTADDTQLTAMIESARKRIVLVAPGTTEAVATALTRKWVELGRDAVQVVLDVDPEVCRLGYGPIKGLTQLTQQAKTMGTLVCHQPGVRIGLLIADESTLIYSPTPLLVEAGGTRTDQPNAILLGHLPEEIARDIGLGENGLQDRTVGLDEVPVGKALEVEAELEANPPAKFDLARKVRVYNSKFQFVELEMKGIHISRRRVNIPGHLFGLEGKEELKSRFHSHFNLVKETSLNVSDKEEKDWDESKIAELKKSIIKKYLINLKGYGTVVMTGNKERLTKEVNTLNEIIQLFRKGIAGKLQEAIAQNINELTEALLPAIARNPPDAYKKYHGEPISAEDLQNCIRCDLENAFGRADKLVEAMSARLVFKDVTYECLEDPTFLAIAKEALPGIKELHEGFDAVRGYAQ